MSEMMSLRRRKKNLLKNVQEEKENKAEISLRSDARAAFAQIFLRGNFLCLLT